MRRRVEALALGIRRSALGPVFALSGLTVRESVRKKIFLILAVFTFAMLGATLMLPSLRPEDRVPLIQTWAQRGITFFGVLLAVFLAGVSLPEDIEERKIFTLLTKPMSRWQLLAGRFWGFALLLAAFALTTGTISSLFIRVVAYRAGGTLANTTEFTASETRVEEEDGAAKVNARRSAEEPFLASVSGKGQAVAVYYFRNIDVTDLPDPVPVRVKLDISGEAMTMFGEVDIWLRPMSADVDATAASKLGWTVSWVSPPQEGQPLPPRLATRRATAKVLVPLEVRVPRSWFGTTGALDVAVKRVKTSTSLVLRPDSIAVISAPHNFEWNFFKALFSTFLLWMVVLSLTISGSTVLSGPVNLLFGIAVFVSGSMIGFLKESIPTVTMQIQEAEKAGPAQEAHAHGGRDIPAPVLRISQAISSVVIGAVPDLGSYDASAPILQGRDIPWMRLFESLRTAATTIVLAFVIGMGLLRMREFR